MPIRVNVDTTHVVGGIWSDRSRAVKLVSNKRISIFLLVDIICYCIFQLDVCRMGNLSTANCKDLVGEAFLL